MTLLPKIISKHGVTILEEYSLHKPLQRRVAFNEKLLRSISFNKDINENFQRQRTSKLSLSSSHYRERSSASDIKYAAATRFGHSDAVFDLFIETQFLHLIALLSNFSEHFLYFLGPTLFEFILHIFADV